MKSTNKQKIKKHFCIREWNKVPADLIAITCLLFIASSFSSSPSSFWWYSRKNLTSVSKEVPKLSQVFNCNYHYLPPNSLSARIWKIFEPVMWGVVAGMMASLFLIPQTATYMEFIPFYGKILTLFSFVLHV